MEKEEFAMMVKDIRQAEKAVGTVSYGATNQEKDNIKFRRSIFCVKDIKKGEVFTEDNVRIIRPGFGMKPKYYPDILGKISTCDIDRGTPFREEFIGGEYYGE